LLNLLDEVTDKHDENAFVSNIVHNKGLPNRFIMCKL